MKTPSANFLRVREPVVRIESTACSLRGTCRKFDINRNHVAPRGITLLSRLFCCLRSLHQMALKSTIFDHRVIRGGDTRASFSSPTTPQPVSHCGRASAVMTPKCLSSAVQRPFAVFIYSLLRRGDATLSPACTQKGMNQSHFKVID